MPTGIPPAASERRSAKSSNSVDVAEGRWAAGLTQSLPIATPRICTISGVILAAGRMPPAPGLAPWLSLISTARGLVAGDGLDEALEAEAPLSVAAPEVPGAELPDEVAAVEVVRGDAALAGALPAARERRAAVDRLHPRGR